MRVVLDGFGGDYSPVEAVMGAVEALESNNELSVIITGNEKEILRIIKDSGKEIPKKLKIVHTIQVVDNEDEPIWAVKNKKDSSLIMGLEMVANNQGDAFVSAGNTGAVFTGATLIIKRIRGIKRGALAPLIPTLKGKGIMVDVGANAECKSEYYPQFALMGSVYAKEVLGVKEPKVGLINIGVEHHKGTQTVVEAYGLLKENKNINFVGNIEARDALNGDVDVLVSDGWTGNILVKTVEGTSSAILTLLKGCFKKTFLTKIAALIIKPHLKEMMKQFDSKETGGALIVGLRSPVVKAHGNSDRTAFKNAILFANKCAESDISLKIEKLINIED